MPLILLWQNKRTDLSVNLPLMFMMRLQKTQNSIKQHRLRTFMILNGMIIWSHQWSYQGTTKFYFPGSNMRRTLNTLKVSNYILNDIFCCFHLFVIQLIFLKGISQSRSVWEVSVSTIKIGCNPSSIYSCSIQPLCALHSRFLIKQAWRFSSSTSLSQVFQ